MKALKALLIVFAVFLPFGQVFSAPSGTAYLSFMEGDVQIRLDGESGWVPASINTPVLAGQGIWVPEGGRTEILLRNGTALRLNGGTALEILTFDERNVQVHLAMGRAYVRYPGEDGGLFRMDTDMATLSPDAESAFDVKISEENACAEIAVLLGAVSVDNGVRQTGVNAGQVLSLKGEQYAEVSPLGSLDEWQKWNVDRDGRYASPGTSSQYLPEELQLYARDFDEYGGWVSLREYGWVWAPRVVFSAGWAPYRVGRWVWIGGDYVWISYEPWGWVSHHYGRWAFVAPIGWCWIPPSRGAVFWSPGYVGWVATSTHISWVPLAPREIYYGYGYYGPYSVDVRKMRRRSLAGRRVVYRNVQVNNAVTTVHRDTFVSGRHRDVHVREPQERFRRGEISPGRPDIRPERATRMPVIRDIPRREQPPPRVLPVKPGLLKERPSPGQEKNAPPTLRRPSGGERPGSAKPVSPTVQQPAGPLKPQALPPVRKEMRKPESVRPSGEKTKRPPQPPPKDGDRQKPEILRPSGKKPAPSGRESRPVGGVPVNRRGRPPGKAAGQGGEGPSPLPAGERRPSVIQKPADRQTPPRSEPSPSDQERLSRPSVRQHDRDRSGASDKAVRIVPSRKPAGQERGVPSEHPVPSGLERTIQPRLLPPRN